MKKILFLIGAIFFVFAFYLFVIYNIKHTPPDTKLDKIMLVVGKQRIVVKDKSLYQLSLKELNSESTVTVFIDSKTYINLGKGYTVSMSYDF